MLLLTRRRKTAAVTADAVTVAGRPFRPAGRGLDAEFAESSAHRLTVDAASRERALHALRPAIQALLARPTQVDLEMFEGARMTTARVRIDPCRGVLDGALVSRTEGEPAAMARHVVVGGCVYYVDPDDQLPALDDSPELGCGNGYFSQAVAGYGRINGSLERILLLMANVPFASKVVRRGRATLEVMVLMSPWAIHSYYRESGLETVGATVPKGLTRLAFLVEDGVLRGLVADGAQFTGGVAHDLSATAVFTPIDPFTPPVPATHR